MNTHATYINVNHILTVHVHMYIICCNWPWEITFSSLFIYYPRSKTVVTTTATIILLLVINVALV